MTGPSLPTSRYNDFLHDPLSLCKACRPQPNGENAISARSDLNPANGSYPFQALQQRSHGGIDAKVCQGPGLWVGPVTMMAGEGVGCRLGQRRWQGGVRVRIGLGVIQARVGAGAPGLGWLGAQPGPTLSHLLCPGPQVTSMALAKALRLVAVSGPTWDQVPPFQWSTSPFSGLLHMGQPDLWKFSPVKVSWD